MIYSVRGSRGTNIGRESHGGRNDRVDLNDGLCICNVPQLLHLPCSHLITTCRARTLDFENPMYMSPLYSREHTLNIWESSFEPYLDPSQWPPYQGPRAWFYLEEGEKRSKAEEEFERRHGCFTRVILSRLWDWWLWCGQVWKSVLQVQKNH